MRRRFMQQCIDEDDLKPMYIEALEDDVSFSFQYAHGYYSIDNIEYVNLESGVNSESINAGQRLYIKCNVNSTTNTKINIQGRCRIGGDVRSTYYGDNYKIFKNGTYQSLLANNVGIESVSKNLLKNVEIIGGCYQNMFKGCTSLTTAPELPATTLASGCYQSMFYGCTSLTTAPELPATTLADYCYEYMFSGCSKLNYIKMLATDISATSCLYNWVKGVASSGTFVKNSAMTSLPTATLINNYAGIPSGWTVRNAVTINTNRLIEFTIINTIDGTTMKYKAEEDMTWEEWCELEYNIGRYKVVANTICLDGSVGSLKENNGYTKVKPSDIIQENVIYYYNDSGNEPS